MSEDVITAPVELLASDVTVTLKKAGKVTLDQLSELANDPNDKVVRVRHADKKVKLEWKHPIRQVQTAVPVLDDDGKQQLDDANRPIFDTRTDEVEDTDPQNIEVWIANGEGEA